MNIRQTMCGAALFCLAACSDPMANMLGEQQGAGEISITGSTEAFTALMQTRTQVGEMADDGVLLIEWSAEDSIGVFGNVTEVNALFKGNNTEPTPSTAFSGTLAEGEVPTYAYYPYSATVNDKTAIPVEIPDEQMYRDEMSVAALDFKASDNIEVSAEGGYRVRFRQMAALVRFEIDLTGYPDLADDELLMDVTIRPAGNGSGAPMTGGFTYDLTDLAAGLQPGAATTDGITIRFAMPPTAREKAVAYAVVAPGAHEGEEWTCTFTTDRQEGEFTTTALCDFEAGKYYIVPLTAQVLVNNEAVVEEIPEEEMEETANCYIVTTPGEHSFKATVIGNGKKGIIPNAGFHTESPYINPKSAKVLWSDRKNFVTNVRVENGRVVYTIPDAIASSVNGSIYGNAVIAVYSEPECKGEILWSWHIWGTDGMPQDVEYTNQAGAKFMVMDRELGRSSAKSTSSDYNVLRYQWGRKDPFPSKDIQVRNFYIDGTTKEAMSNLKGYNYNLEMDATIADAVRNPMHLIHSATQYNWLAEPNVYLWGDGGRELPETLTNANTAGAGWKQQKTIYDPSPVGYRVASVFTFSGFTDMPTGTTQDVTEPDEGNSIVAARLDYINYVEVSGSNWHFQANASDAEGVYYPALRSLEGTNGTEKKNAGSGGYWWTAEAFVGDDGRTYACYLNTDAYKTGSVVAGSTSGNVINTYGRDEYLLRDAYAVRCVRE